MDNIKDILKLLQDHSSVFIIIVIVGLFLIAIIYEIIMYLVKKNRWIRANKKQPVIGDPVMVIATAALSDHIQIGIYSGIQDGKHIFRIKAWDNEERWDIEYWKPLPKYPSRIKINFAGNQPSNRYTKP